jgi:hypothetical protein
VREAAAARGPTNHLAGAENRFAMHMRRLVSWLAGATGHCIQMVIHCLFLYQLKELQLALLAVSQKNENNLTP